MTETVKSPARSITGGNPAGFPDFRPINKLPEHEIRARARELIKIKPVLYQVWVEDLMAHTVIPVSPKCAQSTCAALAFEIANQIQLGTEKRWASPQVKICL